MTWLLRPGVRLARRDADHLQLGIDPPLAAVLPDTRAVRRLLVELAHGSPLTTLDASTAPVLDALVAAGLVVAADDGRRAASTAAPAAGSQVDAPDGVAPGVAAAGRRGRPPARPLTRGGRRWRWSGARASHRAARLDDWMRAGTPHLVVRERPGRPVLGPFVVPGATACLRCVDAHLGEHDPRRALVVEQVATTPPLRPSEPDPALRALALAWAVRDLVAAPRASGRPLVGHGRARPAPADRHDVPPAPRTAAAPGPRTSSTGLPAAR